MSLKTVWEMLGNIAVFFAVGLIVIWLYVEIVHSMWDKFIRKWINGWFNR